MIAAIYSRKSKFTGKGESIENQIQLCMDYAKNIGITEFLVYEDEGFSGGSTDRPKFQDMLADAKDKKFDCLICYRLDRISRNVSDFSALIEELNKLGVSFISIKEQFDTSTPMGRAMMYISSVFAQLERETIAERVKDNMYELARTGRWLGGNTPTGFTSEKITYFDENMNQRSMWKLKVDKEEMKLVELIYSKYEELKSLSQVEKYFLSSNYKGKNNGNLDKSTLQSILRNPCYAKSSEEVIKYLSNHGMDVVGTPDSSHGFLTYAKQSATPIVSIAKHKGVIDSDRWLHIQKILDLNKAKAPRVVSGSNVALLTGLLKCRCGSTMRVNYGSKRKDGTRGHYYICAKKNTKGLVACDNKNINGEQLEEVVINQIKNINEYQIFNSFEESKKSTLDKSKDIKSEKKIIYKIISDTNLAIGNLVKQLSLNTDSSASKYIISEIEKLNQEIESLNNKLTELDNLSKEIDSIDINLNIISDAFIRFRNEFDDADLNTKRFLLSSIIDEIIWDGDTGNINVCYLGTKKKALI